MKLHDAVAGYKAHLKYERCVTQATYDSYSANLNSFLRWLPANGYQDMPDLDVFNANTLRRYQHTISAGGARPRTVLSRMDPLRGMARYLVLTGVLRANPCDSLIMPKKDPPQRALCTDAEARVMLEAADRLYPPRRAALCRALLNVFILAGLRRQECLSLRVADVDCQAKTLTVEHGKGNKRRIVHAPDECLAAVQEWIVGYRPAANHDWLWAYDRNRRLHDQGLRTLIEECATCAGLPDAKRVLPHAMRHAYASRLMANGADMKAIGMQLGHTCAQTTERYLHADANRLKAIAPLASLSPTPTPAPTPAPADPMGALLTALEGQGHDPATLAAVRLLLAQRPTQPPESPVQARASRDKGDMGRPVRRAAARKGR